MKTKNKNKGLTLLMISIISFMLCSVNNSPDASAYYSASLTTGGNVVMNIMPSGDGVSIHEESINVVSDCRSGYNLAIATSTSSNLYADGDSSNNTEGSYFTAVDGTSVLNDTANTNKWGYSLTTNPTGDTVFSPLSTAITNLKTPLETATEDADINDTFSINYGIKVDTNMAPGLYTMAEGGTIVYYLTMDTTCTQYNVNFNANGGTGTMNTQTIEVREATKLSQNSFTAPTESSYTNANNDTITGDTNKLWTFWGWNTAIDGTGDWYKDGEEVTDLISAGTTTTLYAQWKQATLADLVAATPGPDAPKAIDHNTMQDMSPETCYNSDITTAANAPAATLLDYRGKVLTGDNPESPEQYTVSKLPDGLCWMTKNLNLGTTTTGGPNGDGTITLTPDDTDITADFTLPAEGGYATSTNQANVNTPNYLYNHTIASHTVSGTTYGNSIASYYSYAAATADTNTYSAPSSSYITTSICPKHWDLPTEVQYTNLRTKGSVTSANTAFAAPYTFTYGGYRNSASGFNYETSYGYYWTSKNSNASQAFWNYVNNSGLYSASTTSTKNYGAMLRCVASQGTVTINYDGNGTTEYPTTGTIATQEDVEINSATTADGASFTRNGYVFNGWNTAADGSGTSIANIVSLSTAGLAPGSTITLYAQWSPQYTITYVNNCLTYASANSACTATISSGTKSQKINLNASGNGSGTLAPYNHWTLTGWKIAGWTENADGTGTEYKVGTTYNVTGANPGDGITLYAHWVPVYSIQYNGNNADNPNGMGTTNATTGVKSVAQTNVGEGDPVTLLASNFKRSGYGFAGWSTSSTATPTSGDKIYGPNETISAPAYPTNGTNIITLYAVWIAAEKDANNSPVYLQDFDKTKCNALTKTDFDTTTGVITPGSVIALTDKRDNQVYTIAKLADDQCWMVENLRLEHEGTVGNNINDSTVTNESLSQDYGGTTGTYGNFVGLAASESANFTNSTTANSIYKSDGSGSTHNESTGTLEDIGNVANTYPGYRFPRYNNFNTNNNVDGITYTQNYANAASPQDSGTNYRTSSNLYSLGNYYTWAAAMANTNYITNATASEAASTSICPTGWTLPTSGTTTKDFGNLSQQYGGNGQYQGGVGTGDIMSNRFRSFPNNFLYSGYFYSSFAGARGGSGYYWSRSAYSNNYAYYLYLGPTDLIPSSANDKFNGFSVRCVVEP